MERNLDREHYFACQRFADGICLMMKGRFEESRKCLNEAYGILIRIFGNPDDHDTRHVKLFQVILMLAEGNITQAKTQKEFRHAEGMMEYWQAEKLSTWGTNLWHRGARKEACTYYQQAIIYYKKAISIMESALGETHPDLKYPLLDYGSVVKVFNEAEGERISNRGLSLPQTLSNYMLGGGFTLMQMDPYGTSPKLPSECSRAL